MSDDSFQMHDDPDSLLNQANWDAYLSSFTQPGELEDAFDIGPGDSFDNLFDLTDSAFTTFDAAATAQLPNFQPHILPAAPVSQTNMVPSRPIPWPPSIPHQLALPQPARRGCCSKFSAHVLEDLAHIAVDENSFSVRRGGKTDAWKTVLARVQQLSHFTSRSYETVRNKIVALMEFHDNPAKLQGTSVAKEMTPSMQIKLAALLNCLHHMQEAAALLTDEQKAASRKKTAEDEVGGSSIRTNSMCAMTKKCPRSSLPIASTSAHSVASSSFNGVTPAVININDNDNDTENQPVQPPPKKCTHTIGRTTSATSDFSDFKKIMQNAKDHRRGEHSELVAVLKQNARSNEEIVRDQTEVARAHISVLKELVNKV